MPGPPTISQPHHPAVHAADVLLDAVDRAEAELRQQGVHGIEALDQALAYAAGKCGLTVPGIAHLRGLYEARRRRLASAVMDANLRRHDPR